MSEHITYAPAVKRLERSRQGRIVAGVCAGLGRYFDMTPAVFRLGLIVLTLLGGAGILVYIAAILVIPKEGEERSIAEDILANRRDHPVRLIAFGLVAVAVLSLLARADTWPSAGAAWFLVIVAGLMLLWTSTRGRGHRIVVALVSLLALIVVAAVISLFAAFAVFDVSLDDGVGNHSYAPATAAAAAKEYKLGIGKLTVDLTRLEAPAATVHASVGVGELRVLVPHDARVSLNAHVKAGSVDALGRHDDGTSTRVVTGEAGGLVVDANVGAGHVEVMRAP